jgi:hypothetical protein
MRGAGVILTVGWSTFTVHRALMRREVHVRRRFIWRHLQLLRRQLTVDPVIALQLLRGSCLMDADRRVQLREIGFDGQGLLRTHVHVVVHERRRVLNLRNVSISINQLSLFIWTTIVTTFLLVLSLPAPRQSPTPALSAESDRTTDAGSSMERS